jgi:hypothetical protein
MKKIDLHGIKHEEVEKIISNACSKLKAPFIVITGNSEKMKELVNKTISFFGLRSTPSSHNPGRMIIDERR